LEHVDKDGNIEEAVDLLIHLKDGLPKDKTKAKPTKIRDQNQKGTAQNTSAGPYFAKGSGKSRTKEKNIS
jgi:hypothetical protein